MCSSSITVGWESRSAIGNERATSSIAPLPPTRIGSRRVVSAARMSLAIFSSYPRVGTTSATFATRSDSVG